VLSAQPAVGERSPRIFLTYPEVTLTVVPAGPGASLLEMGEPRDGARSLKGELSFPIELPPSEDAAYERLVPGVTGATSCGACHGAEEQVAPGRFESIALRPHPDTLVSVSDLASEPCEVEDERCAMLRALFDHGPVVYSPFPEDLPTIYQTE
jgi:hypothetical protein